MNMCDKPQKQWVKQTLFQKLFQFLGNKPNKGYFPVKNCGIPNVLILNSPKRPLKKVQLVHVVMHILAWQLGNTKSEIGGLEKVTQECMTNLGSILQNHGCFCLFNWWRKSQLSKTPSAPAVTQRVPVYHPTSCPGTMLVIKKPPNFIIAVQESGVASFWAVSSQKIQKKNFTL